MDGIFVNFGQFSDGINTGKPDERDLSGFDDTKPGQGVQYIIKWIRPVRFAVDYIEIYDRLQINDYVNFKDIFTTNITNKANEVNISNQKYWHSSDAPLVEDLYAPYKIVDDILVSLNRPRLFTPFYPRWNNEVNGYNTMERFISYCKPQTYAFWYYPMWVTATNPRDCTPTPYENMDNMLEILRGILQQAYLTTNSLNYEFQYYAPVMEYKEAEDKKVYRQPEPTELGAMVMLALAHGAKGLYMQNYRSQWALPDPNATGNYIRYIGLTDVDGVNKYPLWHYLKNNITPRINGKLGNTLLNLNYTGEHLDIYYEIPTNKPLTTIEKEYLKIRPQDLPSNQGLHIGFLKYKYDNNLKYFFLTSKFVRPEWTQTCKLVINEGHTLNNFINWTVKNIEADEIISFNSTSSVMLNIILEPGGGKLYCVAPTVKYGGNLLLNETISGIDTLRENVLYIKDGVTLTVNSTYNIYKDIIVEPGATLELGVDSYLNFYDGAKLIINGSILSHGNSIERPELNFNGGIRSGIVLNTRCNIQNLNIKNAEVGITFMITTHEEETPYTTVIKNNFFDNCVTGILVTNTPMVLIQGNTFNCHAINLSNVQEFNIVNNSLDLDNPAQQDWPGIEIFSSTGKIRNNTISDFGMGVLLARSSVSFGNNIIENNNQPGLYIADYSEADLRSARIRVPCVPGLIYYSIKGSNTIRNNNESNEYDGAEIYLVESSILLDEGSNYILDNRPSDLFPTQTLIDGEGVGESIKASRNDWGFNPEFSTTSDRFGTLEVNYEPEGVFEPDLQGACPFIVTTTDNIVIDTVDGITAVTENLQPIDYMYISADQRFYEGDYETAETEYQGIIAIYYDNRDAILAYSRLHEILVLTDGNQEDFDALREYYGSFISSITDAFILDYVEHLIEMCFVNGERVESAINSFQNTINTYPGTEKALFAEVDMLTAALLDTSISLGKGLVKINPSNFHEKLQNLFNRTGKSGTKNIQLPVEYSLFQNYPNPFNPSTTIQYDVPKASKVSLIVYDVLGREVAILVNEVKEQGRYTAQFNASSLSSGMYIYKITAGKFVSAKKMMLVK